VTDAVRSSPTLSPRLRFVPVCACAHARASQVHDRYSIPRASITSPTIDRGLPRHPARSALPAEVRALGSGVDHACDIDAPYPVQGQRARSPCPLLPHVEGTYDLSRLITVSRKCCSTALTCRSHVVPKLETRIRFPSPASPHTPADSGAAPPAFAWVGRTVLCAHRRSPAVLVR